MHGDTPNIDLGCKGMVDALRRRCPSRTVPMPMAMRGMLGSSLERPASRTVAKAAMSWIFIARLLTQHLDLADQRLLLDVACGSRGRPRRRGECALAEAGDGADREAPVRRGQRQLVGRVGSLLEAELELDALEQRSRPVGLAGGAAADRHGVRPLRIKIEERENVATP